MKKSNLFALATATMLTGPMAVSAGGLAAPVDDRQVIVLPEGDSVQPGSLRGSLAGPAAAGLIALLILGAAGSGGGS